jgi:hypothetical protein
MGWNMHSNFCPQPDWYTFGWFRAQQAYIHWKYACHGDNVPSEPANIAFDMTYVAHMAVLDGLLSCDGDMLKLAWACWPEKRQDIHTLDRASGEIVAYRPAWEA